MVIYFCLLIFDYVIGFERFRSIDSLGFIMVITLLAFALSVHASPLGVSMRKTSFSLIWMLISFLFLFLPYGHYKNFEMLFSRSSFPFALPFLGFIYYHIIRQIYKLIMKREPITLRGKYFQYEYIQELDRSSDKYDFIFTLISLFGFFTIFGIIISR